MELAELFCLLAMGIHLILGGVVLYRSPRNVVNQTFALLLLLFFCWSLAEILLLRHGGPIWPLKFLLTPVFLLFFFFARFSALFPRRVEGALILGPLWRSAFFFLPTAWLLWMLWSNNLIAAYDMIPGGFLLSFGPHEFTVKGIAVAYLLLSLKNLSRARQNLTPEFQERRFHYTFAGLMLPATAGSVFIALGRWYVTGRTIYTCGIFPALGILMAVLIAYAILRYQLLEIDALFSIGLIYTLLTIILAGGMELLQNTLQNYFDLTGTWSIIFSTLVIAAVFAPLKDLIVRLVDRVFGKQELDGAIVMRRIKMHVRQGDTPAQVLEQILRDCQTVFDLSAIAAVMRNGLVAAHCTDPASLPTLPLASSTDPRPAPSAVSNGDNGPHVAGAPSSRFNPPLLPPLPDVWPPLDDIEAVIESGRETAEAGPAQAFPDPSNIRTPSPEPSCPEPSTSGSVWEAWRNAGFRFAFPLHQQDAIAGGLFLTPRPGRLPFSAAERSILLGICLEIPTILENVTLISTLLERDRDVQELGRARLMYLQIQGDQNLRQFQGRPVRLFSSLARQIKGDLIDLCPEGPAPFIALCDAFHSGIPAALTLYIVRTALRSAPAPDRLETVHRLLREFADPQLGSALTLLTFPDLSGRRINIINAGNIPPLLAGPNGVCRPLIDIGRPLGLAEAPDAARLELDLPPDHFLLCATNGLAKAFGDSQGKNLIEFLADPARRPGIEACHQEIQQKLSALPGRSEFPDDITYILLGG